MNISSIIDTFLYKKYQSIDIEKVWRPIWKNTTYIWLESHYKKVATFVVMATSNSLAHILRYLSDRGIICPFLTSLLGVFPKTSDSCGILRTHPMHNTTDTGFFFSYQSQENKKRVSVIGNSFAKKLCNNSLFSLHKLKIDSTVNPSV